MVKRGELILIYISNGHQGNPARFGAFHRWSTLRNKAGRPPIARLSHHKYGLANILSASLLLAKDIDRVERCFNSSARPQLQVSRPASFKS